MVSAPIFVNDCDSPIAIIVIIYTISLVLSLTCVNELYYKQQIATFCFGECKRLTKIKILLSVDKQEFIKGSLYFCIPGNLGMNGMNSPTIVM